MLFFAYRTGRPSVLAPDHQRQSNAPTQLILVMVAGTRGRYSRADFGRGDQCVRRPPPHGQDVGPQLLDAHWGHARRRELPHAHSQGIRVLRDGVFRLRRGVEHPRFTAFENRSGNGGMIGKNEKRGERILIPAMPAS